MGPLNKPTEVLNDASHVEGGLMLTNGGAFAMAPDKHDLVDFPTAWIPMVQRFKR